MSAKSTRDALRDDLFGDEEFWTQLDTSESGVSNDKPLIDKAVAHIAHIGHSKEGGQGPEHVSNDENDARRETDAGVARRVSFSVSNVSNVSNALLGAGFGV